MDNPQRTRAGVAAFVAFLACIPVANWLIPHVGTVCVPDGPCLVPVAPGVVAPSGVLTVGVALVLRYVLQRCLSVRFGLLAIAAGSLEFLPGQIIGKVWAVPIAIPLVRLPRRVAPTPA
jgi:hypothetical protein